MASYPVHPDPIVAELQARLELLQADYEHLVDLMTPVVLAATQVVRLGRLDPHLLDLLARSVAAYEAALRRASRLPA
jgi:hypothetical protein